MVQASLWLALIHDWSKFLPSEWFPYVRAFYNKDGSSKYEETDEFNYAWKYHQNRQKHHHQYWLLKMDDGRVVPLKMPEKYVREMLGDWIGAGLVITGKLEVWDWYEKNKENMILHEDTRKLVEDILGKLKAQYEKILEEIRNEVL